MGEVDAGCTCDAEDRGLYVSIADVARCGTFWCDTGSAPHTTDLAIGAVDALEYVAPLIGAGDLGAH